jgi:hypothetical protein
MSNVVNRILTEQLGGRHAETFIGKPGELFFDAQSGQLRIGDGETIGGQVATESSPLESLFIGPWVHFVRPDDSEEVVDKIADNLWLARAEGGSLYNRGDNGDGDPWETDGYELNTPHGTQWNTDGWDDFSNTTDRYYENLTNAWAGGGWAITKHNWIMRDTLNDKYYAIKFLSWDGGDNNATGAFSYIRREINTAIYFSREDTDDEATALENGDVIAENLVITRGDGRAIFNIGQALDTRWTQFTTSSFGATWYDTGVIAIEWDTEADINTALNQLKVGDEIFLDNDDGYSMSTTIAEVDVQEGTFRTTDVPPAQITIAIMYMNLTKLYTIEDNYDDDESPIGTLWNSEGYQDLSNLMSRQWMVFNDLTNGESLGKRIVGKELVMWDTVNDKYYAITFTRWQNGEAGSQYPGFAYTRREIDVNKLTAGLKFNDGTVQHTAYSDKIAGVLKQTPRLSSTTNTRWITPSDIGKVIYLNGATTTQYLKLGDGGTADFPVGATITIINRTGGTIYLAKENDDENGTIYVAGASYNSRYLAIGDSGGGSICTLMKIETGMDNFFNDWMISGSNISDDS